MTGGTRRGVAGTLFTALLAGLAAGCATGPNRVPSDPLEPMNRGVFWFNERVDQFVLEPVATGWDFVLPDRAQTSVSNFFRNLNSPVVFVNDVLQLKLGAAGTDVVRFGVNTTVGVLGLFDPAAGWGLDPNDEDFGQTLGTWGIGQGFYLVLPLLGPSSPRDALAMPVDGALNPVPYLVDWEIWLAARGVETVNTRARLLEEIEANREMAFDYYVFVRDAWRDYRRNQVRDGASKDAGEEDDLYHLE